MQRDHLSAIKWKDIHDVFFLPMVMHLLTHHCQGGGGAHHKKKLASLLDYKYKTGVDRSVQMLSFYSFERMTIKWWKKLFFHLFDLVAVNAHILHNKTSKKKNVTRSFLRKSC
jgi:hypothetical protein